MRHEPDPRVRTLRLTLLAALGLLPVACGGATDDRTNAIGGDSGTGGLDTSRAGSNTGGAAHHSSGVSCTNPNVDPVSGLISCDEGYTHRPSSKTCGQSLTGVGKSASDQRQLARINPGAVPCRDNPSICEKYQFGYCEGGLGGPVCWSGCADDADCGEGSICLCGVEAGYGVCTLGACQTDAECGGGYTCASYSGGCSVGYACQTPEDVCVVAADCPEPGQGCQPGPNGTRTCTPSCTVGRPFLVADDERVAPVVASGAWRGRAGTPRVDHLSSQRRVELAAHWARLGQLEHASIAAFARFSLQLMGLGAPPELVEASTRALADETAHTRLCFELASAYAGRELGPGPLETADCLARSSLEQIVDLVIQEGCFGETIAALDAQRAADRASDSVIQQAYQQIASDETRHAELAFRFVRWALQQDYETTSRRIIAALAGPRADAAVAGVVAPCLEALLFATQAA